MVPHMASSTRNSSLLRDSGSNLPLQDNGSNHHKEIILHQACPLIHRKEQRATTDRRPHSHTTRLLL